MERYKKTISRLLLENNNRSLIPYIVKTDEFEILTFQLASFLTFWPLLDAHLILDTLYGREEIMDLLVCLKCFKRFAQRFDIDARQWYVEFLHGYDNLFAVKTRTVHVAMQGGNDGLLNGIKELWCFLNRDLFDG